MLRVLLLFSLVTGSASAYLDTTPKDFVKPRPIQVKPYTYVRPQYDIYMDKAAETIAPKVFGSIAGPAGTVINLADKAIKIQEQDAKQ